MSLGVIFYCLKHSNDIIIVVHCSANLYYQSYHFHLFYMMQQKRRFVATKNGKCCPKGRQGGEEEHCPKEYNLLDMWLSSMPRIQLPTKQNLDHRDEMRLI